MENLWAPWRAEYIYKTDEPVDGCIFCEYPKSDNDRDHLILCRGKHTFVIMNKFPYNNGHLMVVPFRHASDILELNAAEETEMWQMVKKSKSVLATEIMPHGFNIGMNLGRPAGAGIDTHIHLHLVPRWNGDTNFMPVLGKTKVISEALFTTYDRFFSLFSE